MMKGIPDIRKGGKPLAAVAVIILIAMSVLLFVFPDDGGKIRTDLVVGDFYEFKNEALGSEIRFEIADMDGDILTVNSTTAGEHEITYTCGKDEFLSKILFNSEELKSKCEVSGISLIKTFHGTVLCDIYKNQLSYYYVDEYGVIYHSIIGGMSLHLVNSSLFIGYDAEGGS